MAGNRNCFLYFNFTVDDVFRQLHQETENKICTANGVSEHGRRVRFMWRAFVMRKCEKAKELAKFFALLEFYYFYLCTISLPRAFSNNARRCKLERAAT